MDIRNIFRIFSALSTVVILSRDLGLDYNQNEETIYTHPLFNFLAVFSYIVVESQDFNIGSIVFIIIISLKYFKINKNNNKNNKKINNKTNNLEFIQ